MRVDEELVSRGYSEFKHWVDDYTFFTNRLDTARKFVRDIEDVLAQYRLTLNEHKLHIGRIRARATSDWASSIRAITLGSEATSGSQVERFLYELSSIATSQRDASVMRYGLSTLFAEPVGGRFRWIAPGVANSAAKILEVAQRHTECAPFAAQVWLLLGPSAGLSVSRNLLAAIQQRRTDAILWYLDSISEAGLKPRRHLVSLMLRVPRWFVVPLAFTIRRNWLEKYELRALGDYVEDLPDDYARDEHWVLTHELDVAQGRKTSSCDLQPLLLRNLSIVAR